MLYMSDDRLIRLQNLKAMNLGPTDLKRRFGRSVSYWSDMLNNRKSFGEDVARDIEERAALPRYWMDTPHDISETKAALSTPTQAPNAETQQPAGAGRLVQELLTFMRELDPLVAPSAKDVIRRMLDGELDQRHAIDSLNRLQAMSAATTPTKRTGTG